MTLLLPMTVASLLVSGMGVAILGSIKVPLARRLDIDEARVGGMVSVFGFVMIPVVFTAGFLTDLLGKQGVLMGGSLLMAASTLSAFCADPVSTRMTPEGPICAATLPPAPAIM